MGWLEIRIEELEQEAELSRQGEAARQRTVAELTDENRTLRAALESMRQEVRALFLPFPFPIAS